MVNENWQDELQRQMEYERIARRLLGVSDSVGKEDLKHAWRQKSLAHHPNRNNNNPEHTRRVILINCAYRFLLEGTPCAMLLSENIPASINRDVPEGTVEAYLDWWRENFCKTYF